MPLYPGLVHKDPDSDYGIHFPDVPGCFSAGETMLELYDMAAEALTAHRDLMRQHGEQIPSPSAASKHDSEGCYAVVWIPLEPA